MFPTKVTKDRTANGAVRDQNTSLTKASVTVKMSRRSAVRMYK